MTMTDSRNQVPHRMSSLRRFLLRPSPKLRRQACRRRPLWLVRNDEATSSRPHDDGRDFEVGAHARESRVRNEESIRKTRFDPPSFRRLEHYRHTHRPVSDADQEPPLATPNENMRSQRSNEMRQLRPRDLSKGNPSGGHDLRETCARERGVEV